MTNAAKIARLESERDELRHQRDWLEGQVDHLRQILEEALSRSQELADRALAAALDATNKPEAKRPLHQNALDARRRGELPPLGRAATRRPDSDYEARIPDATDEEHDDWR